MHMRWTPEEECIIADNWQTHSDLELCAMLPGREYQAVKQHRANVMRLVRKNRQKSFHARPVEIIGDYPARKTTPVWHGTVPANPISEEYREQIYRMKQEKGTYGEARA